MLAKIHRLRFEVRINDGEQNQIEVKILDKGFCHYNIH